MIKPIKIKVRPTGDTFLIHDTKGDIRKLAEAKRLNAEQAAAIKEFLEGEE